jgi:hypothetical protein
VLQPRHLQHDADQPGRAERRLLHLRAQPHHGHVRRVHAQLPRRVLPAVPMPPGRR